MPRGVFAWLPDPRRPPFNVRPDQDIVNPGVDYARTKDDKR